MHACPDVFDGKIKTDDRPTAVECQWGESLLHLAMPCEQAAPHGHMSRRDPAAESISGHVGCGAVQPDPNGLCKTETCWQDR